VRKVFGIGISKTGTKTLGVCLERLGYRHPHWDAEFARDVVGGNIDRAFRMADEFEGFEDFPWPLLYRQLDERYPDALFILTTRRDPDTWIKSLLLHAERTGPTRLRAMIYGYDMPQGHEEQHIAQYERHNAEVQRYFADRPGKLLEVCWETGSGWTELCAFLDHPIVDDPFPHVNARPRRNPWRGTRQRAARLSSRLARALHLGQ
jgi:hypothetical protein